MEDLKITITDLSVQENGVFKKIEHFPNIEQAAFYLKNKCFNVYWNGNKKKYLINIAHNINDRRLMKSPYLNKITLKLLYKEYYINNFLVKDAYGKVLHKDYLTDLMLSFSYEKWEEIRKEASRIRSNRHKKSTFRDNFSELWKLPDWKYGYRNIRTTQERRWSEAEDHKDLCRARRNFKSLPNSWDDMISRPGYNWKVQSKRKKQWIPVGPKKVHWVNDIIEAEDLYE